MYLEMKFLPFYGGLSNILSEDLLLLKGFMCSFKEVIVYFNALSGYSASQ